MRTLHVGLRVVDVERSIAFYTAIGYEVLGGVPATHAWLHTGSRQQILDRPTARLTSGRRGSATLTATASSSSSGPKDIPTA